MAVNIQQSLQMLSQGGAPAMQGLQQTLNQVGQQRLQQQQLKKQQEQQQQMMQMKQIQFTKGLQQDFAYEMHTAMEGMSDEKTADETAILDGIAQKYMPQFAKTGAPQGVLDGLANSDYLGEDQYKSIAMANTNYAKILGGKK